MNERYDTHGYWDERLTDQSLSAVGHLRMGRTYNYWLYQAKKRLFVRTFNEFGPFRSMVDVGTGLGTFIGWSLAETESLGDVAGLDISPSALEKVRTAFPSAEFQRADIGESVPDHLLGLFDLVNCWEVLYHITDDSRHKTAVTNLCRMGSDRAVLLLTDLLVDTRDEDLHVRYRDLNRFYAPLLKTEGYSIASTRPFMYFLSRKRLNPASFVGFALRALHSSLDPEKVLAPVSYWLDGGLLSRFTRFAAGPRLLVAVRRD